MQQVKMKKLRQFIREEIVWNYWMRRPRNVNNVDANTNIETQRSSIFADVVIDFKKMIKSIEHTIKTSTSISDIENSLIRVGLDAYEIVSDTTVFDDAVIDKDVDEVKRQLIAGLKVWSPQIIKNTMDDNYNYSTLQNFLDQNTN